MGGGQSFNLPGTVFFMKMVLGRKQRRLAIPHVSVPDIRYVDWRAVRAAGFTACVFDKDNTLTLPYALEVHDPLRRSLQECIDAFDGRVALLSNSAGMYEYDPDGKEADLIESRLGVAVLRHREKKPAGGCSELEEYFACGSQKMVMVGDRYFTDVAYGNRHGMLTVRVAPLTDAREKTTVRWSRALEDKLVGRWTRKGLTAPKQAMLQAGVPVSFVKSPGIW